MNNEYLKKLQENYPFLSYLEYDGQEYIGIIQKSTTQFVWLYDFDRIKNENLEKPFLTFGQKWFYESNMEIPIEMFIGAEFAIFKHCLRGFVRTAVKNYCGPDLCLATTFKKRIKKKRIELVRDLT